MSLIHTMQTDETYFDKPRIIRHIKSMLAKLRRKKILVEDIVSHINKQGIPMTRARFEDLFTSRPTRVTIATPATVIACINACFSYDKHVITAHDVLDLADAARLPLRFYDQLAIHFNTAEWQAAWFELLPTTKPQLNRHQLIHRNSEFARMLQAYNSERHIFIIGDAGVGKTALAQALIIEIELLSGHKIATVYLQQSLKSLTELIKLSAQAFNIKPLHNEPIELRMESILNKGSICYLFIDNLQLTSQELSIVSAFVKQFSNIRIIVTSPRSPLPHDLVHDESINPHIEHLALLPDSTPNSPAMVLFIQALNNHGIHYANDDLFLLHSMCKQAHGNPMQILQLASMHSSYHKSNNARGIRDSIDRMNPVELQLFTFLALITEPLSQNFLLAYFAQHITKAQIEENLQLLIHHGMIERLYHEHTFSYRVPQRLCSAYLASLAPHRQQSEYELHITHLSRFVTHEHLEILTTVTCQDSLVILNVIQRVVAQHSQLLFDVAKLLIHWLELWLYHDVSAQIIIFGEQLLMQHRVVHPALAELCVALGRMYTVRGQHEQALRLQHLACQYVSAQNYPYIWAQSIIVTLHIYVNTQHSDGTTRTVHQIPQVITILESTHRRHWLAYAHHVLSIMHSNALDITTALAENEQSIQHCIDRSLNVAYIFTNFQRSLLYMYAGNYDMARAVLNKLHHDLQPYDVPYYSARLHMRLAAIEALLHNTSIASQHVANSFAVLKSMGNVGELLFIADIYSLILYRQARFQEALEISNLCTKLRSDYSMHRANYIELLVERKRANIAHTIHARVEPPATDSTIYDLLARLSDMYVSLLQSQLQMTS